MCVGIILAGGMSKRMGENKIMMPFNDDIMVDHLIKLYSAVCEKVVVVTGHYHQEIASYLEKERDVIIKYNPNYPKGMFSSILKGIENENDDVLITPGDIPLVKLETLQKILTGNGCIRVPSYKRKLGHPIFLSKKMVEALKHDGKYPHLKAFRNDMGFTIIETNDDGVTIDFDSKDSFIKYKGRGRYEN
jgi:molybdenum cofactor cytidylyltransferase